MTTGNWTWLALDFTLNLEIVDLQQCLHLLGPRALGVWETGGNSSSGGLEVQVTFWYWVSIVTCWAFYLE